MSILNWPLRWPLNLFCSHPSTSGLLEGHPDGSGRWVHVELKCLRCGRDLPLDEGPS